jgi:type IX secretion system PorP/SprF family membrane protein
MKKVVVLLFSLLGFASSIKAQNFDLYNTYFSNPYLINPAEGATDYSTVFLHHRKQWLGFNGAPEISTLTYTSRFNKSKSGWGLKLSSAANGITKINDALITYVHGVGLNDHQTLSFALSAGGTSKSVDLSKIDTNDPALANYLDDNLNPSANFGMLFHCNSGLNVGITLPELLNRSINYSEEPKSEFISPSQEIIVNAYYSRNMASGIVSKKKKGVSRRVRTGEKKAPLELFLLYRYRENEQGQAEALVKVNLSDKVAIAGGYRQWLGPMAALHLDFQKLLLSYSYEPMNVLGEFTTSSHELQLGLRIGKEKEKLKKKVPQLKSTIKGEVKEQHIARFQQENQTTLEEPGLETKKFYVVIRSFKEFDAADDFKKKLITQKFNANVFYYEGDKQYHVYVFESTRSGEAHTEARNIKAYTKLKQARVLTVTQQEK